MVLKKIAALLAAGLCFAGVLSAKELTVDRAVKYALENNISVQKDKITLDALKREKNHSWNGVSPSASVSANMLFPAAGDARQYDYNFSIQGSLNFSLSPSIYSSIKSASLNYENGLLTYDEALRSIELKVRSAFYHLLYELEYIELQRRNLETARQQYEQNSRKYKSGQLSELDMLSSQVKYERLKPTLESAEITFANDSASFKQMLGIDQSTEVVLSGSLADARSFGDISVEVDAEDTPVVRAGKNSVKIARAALLARRFAAWGPTVSAGWTYGKSKTNIAKDFSTTNALSIGVSIPLDGYLPWSKGADSVASAADNVKTAELTLENSRTTVAVQIDNYVKQIRQIQSQIASLQANVDLAKKSYDMTKDAYNHGSRDLLSLQTASDSLLNARTDLAQQEYTLITKIINLEYTLGVPFGSLGR